jgi:hypothetical protein
MEQTHGLRTTLEPDIGGIRECDIDIAAALLSRFFAEEGFSGTPETIAANTRRLLSGPPSLDALAWCDGGAVGYRHCDDDALR